MTEFMMDHNQFFTQYNMPIGFLVKDSACHALFRYYLMARQTYETHVLDPIVYEGEKDPEYNFKQLFSSVAKMYGVEPEHMTKYWINVDMQCDLLGLPLMPDEEKYRFDRVQEIKTDDS